MFKKVLVPLMLVAVLLLSACAQPTEAPTKAPQPTATPKPPEPTPEPEPEGLSAPTGDVILVVTGDIETPNVGDECQFDAHLFDQYAITQDLDDPWMGDGLDYRGLTLATIWELCGGAAGAEAATLVAEDGMTIEIAAADLQEWPIMVAYQVGGEDLINDLGGPVKMVYPAAAGDTYGDDKWMWWLAEIQIGASTAPKALAAPTGDVILVVTGDIETPNVGDECQFDAHLFDQYAITQDLDDPWMGDGLDYRGLTLATIWELCGGAAGAEAATLVAEDGMTIEIAAADLQEWPIMVAYQVGGEDLINDLGGPVKMVYPAAAGDTYGDDKWMWWLAEIQIGASTAPKALAAPTGDVILVVTGDIETPNVGDECQFDAHLFDQYAITQDLDDPWMGDGLDYRGLTLATIWELCGGAAGAEAATLVAEDGMTIEIAAADLQEWPIMVAYQVGGEDLISDLGGPVKIVFPADAGETYADDQWMWWIVEVKIQ